MVTCPCASPPLALTRLEGKPFLVSLCLGGDPAPRPPESQSPQRQEIHGAAPGAGQARTSSLEPALIPHSREKGPRLFLVARTSSLGPRLSRWGTEEPQTLENRSALPCSYERSHYIYENKASSLQNELSPSHPAGRSRPPAAPITLRITKRKSRAKMSR
jgi:hypothetical protein